MDLRALLLLLVLSTLMGCPEVGIVRVDLISYCAAWSNTPAPTQTAEAIARVCER